MKRFRSQPRCPVASLTRVQTIRAVDWSPRRSSLSASSTSGVCRVRSSSAISLTLDDVCDAIRTLAVRGAPAIGVAGAMGMVVVLDPLVDEPLARFRERVRSVAATIRATRPTAVNLPWAIDRMLRAGARRARRSPRAILDALRAEATSHSRRGSRDVRAHRRRTGCHCFRDGARVLTHCNAGALATAGIGTALAPIYLAAAFGSSHRGVRGRDSAAPAGKSPNVVGAGAGGHSGDRHRRQHGGVAHACWPNRPVHRRCGSDRPQW